MDCYPVTYTCLSLSQDYYSRPITENDICSFYNLIKSDIFKEKCPFFDFLKNYTDFYIYISELIEKGFIKIILILCCTRIVGYFQYKFENQIYRNNNGEMADQTGVNIFRENKYYKKYPDRFNSLDSLVKQLTNTTDIDIPTITKLKIGVMYIMSRCSFSLFGNECYEHNKTNKNQTVGKFMWQEMKSIANNLLIADNLTQILICSTPLDLSYTDTPALTHHLGNGMSPIYGKFLKFDYLDKKMSDYEDDGNIMSEDEINLLVSSLNIPISDIYTKEKFVDSFAELIWILSFDDDIDLFNHHEEKGEEIDPFQLLYYLVEKE